MAIGQNPSSLDTSSHHRHYYYYRAKLQKRIKLIFYHFRIEHEHEPVWDDWEILFRPLIHFPTTNNIRAQKINWCNFVNTLCHLSNRIYNINEVCKFSTRYLVNVKLSQWLVNIKKIWEITWKWNKHLNAFFQNSMWKTFAYASIRCQHETIWNLIIFFIALQCYEKEEKFPFYLCHQRIEEERCRDF